MSDRDAPSARRLSRRSFLRGLPAAAAGLGLWGGTLTEALAVPPLRRPRHYPPQPFAPFPTFTATGRYGAGTYRMGSYRLLEEALEGGVRLVATSPGYRDTYTEREVGGVLERFPEPVFVMTQVPTGAWTEGSRTVAFHRGLRESLGRLRRGNVEGLLIRNAEPDQLTDPEFREFAAQVKESGYVERIGVSGHGTDLEKVLEIVVDDPLYEIVLFAAYLVRYEAVPPLLARAAGAGKILVAMKVRELAMEDRLPGWEAEAERQRHVPWDGRWGESFTRRALVHALAETPAANALVSIREREDVAVAVDASEPEGG